MTLQVPEAGGVWPTLTTSPIGVNGRGARRPGTTKTVGGRTVTSGQDATNELTTTKD